MEIIPVKTPVFTPPQDAVLETITNTLPPLQEGDIIVITSKVVAIDEGRAIAISEVSDKDALIAKEADRFIPRSAVPNQWVTLTITHHALLPTAGIDESNANGYYLLLPKDPFASAKRFADHFRHHSSLTRLGVIIADSHTLPLRYGTVGIALGFFGIEPLKKYSGTADLFGRPFRFSRKNVVDELAAIAVFMMGEGTEQTPVVVLRDVPHVTFTNENKKQDWLIPPQEDIYAPLLKPFFDAD